MAESVNVQEEKNRTKVGGEQNKMKLRSSGAIPKTITNQKNKHRINQRHEEVDRMRRVSDMSEFRGFGQETLEAAERNKLQNFYDIIHRSEEQLRQQENQNAETQQDKRKSVYELSDSDEEYATTVKKNHKSHTPQYEKAGKCRKSLDALWAQNYN